MPINLPINGVNEPYPANGDPAWGTDATATMQKLVNAALFQTGKRGDNSDFTLTGEINWGAAYGHIVALIKSASANIADSGFIRLANGDKLSRRNAANDGNIELSLNGDVLEWNGSKVILASDVVNDDTTGGTAVPSSAEIVKTHGTEIDLIKNASAGLYRNAIINPIDENMVDQYSFSGAIANNVYAVDRWKTTVNATSPTYNKGADTIGLTSNATESTKNAFLQVLEDVNYEILAGKEITVSAIVSANDSDCRLLVTDDSGISYKASNVHGGSGGEETLSVTFTVTGSPTSMNVYIGYQSITAGNVSITSGKLFTFKNAQLTLGDTVLPYQPRQYGEELALCQRYYFTLIYKSGMGQPTGGTIGFGKIYSATRADAFIVFPVTMRDKPSLVLNTSAGGYVYEESSAKSISLDGSGIFLADENVNRGNLIDTNVSGMNIGNAVQVYCVNADCYVAFNAEL